MSNNAAGSPLWSPPRSATAAIPSSPSSPVFTSIPFDAAGRNSMPNSTAGPPTEFATPARGDPLEKKRPGRLGGPEDADRAGHGRRSDDRGQVRPPQSAHPQRGDGRLGSRSLPHDGRRNAAGPGLQLAC